MNRLHPPAFHFHFVLVLVGGLELQVQDASSRAQCVSGPWRSENQQYYKVLRIETIGKEKAIS
jgi:hypothetical protein